MATGKYKLKFLHMIKFVAIATAKLYLNNKLI